MVISYGEKLRVEYVHCNLHRECLEHVKKFQEKGFRILEIKNIYHLFKYLLKAVQEICVLYI